ncbi:MAG: hypothetical protein Q8W51_00100 [Candidatus Palauibacterales bacterium]|nr:hypothetical protein [Candidatus Palauibacterales bacterium]
MSAPTRKACDWAARYEALRAQATGAGPLGFVPLGLAVLTHRGVVAWMVAEARSVEPAGQRAAHESGARAPGLDLPSARSELVGLLAHAALVVARGRGR